VKKALESAAEERQSWEAAEEARKAQQTETVAGSESTEAQVPTEDPTAPSIRMFPLYKPLSY
jgi:hypothetical protein